MPATNKNDAALLAQLKEEFEKVAKKLKCPPLEVPRAAFWEYTTIGTQTRLMKRHGGYTEVKNSLFNPSPVPLKAAKPAAKSKAKSKPVDDDNFDPGEEPPPPNPLTTKECRAMQDGSDELRAHVCQFMRDCADKITEQRKEAGLNPVLPHELVWGEYARFIHRRWGADDLKLAANTITRAGGFNMIRDASFAILPTQTTVAKYQLQKEAAHNRKLGRAFAEMKFVMESVEEFTNRIFSGRVTVDRPLKLVDAPTKRVVNLLLSDLHIGSDIRSKETGQVDFGPVEEARRLAHVVKQAAEYKLQYRPETELKLLLCGDLIQNSLHDPRDGAVLAEQFARAIHLLLQAIAYLSGHFKKVVVECTPGNHDRSKSRHLTRAVNEKFDGLGTMIHYALKRACTNLPNVTFNIPRTPFTIFDTFSYKGFLTHGDTVFSPGNPGKNVHVAALETQMNRINASLKDTEEYRVFACGHIHLGTYINLNNGAKLITNGPLVPVDAYSVSLGHFENACGQSLWESVESFPVGDFRFVDVGTAQDRDASLDKIIEPWCGDF